MSNSEFDELAKRLATRVSRLTALRLTLGAVAAGIAARFGSGDALATTCVPPGTPLCNGKCCQAGEHCTSGRCLCGNSGHGCQPNQVCVNGQCVWSCGQGQTCPHYTTLAGNTHCVSNAEGGVYRGVCTPGGLPPFKDCTSAACTTSQDCVKFNSGTRFNSTQFQFKETTYVCQTNSECNGTCGGNQNVCVPLFDYCYGQCVNTETDPYNCGTCGHACGANQFCSSGVCFCTTGRLCGSRCVDTNNDPNNCRGCGNRCGPGETCSFGRCYCGSTSGTIFLGPHVAVANPACTGGTTCVTNGDGGKVCAHTCTNSTPGTYPTTGCPSGCYCVVPAGGSGPAADCVHGGTCAPNGSCSDCSSTQVCYQDTINCAGNNNLACADPC